MSRQRYPAFRTPLSLGLLAAIFGICAQTSAQTLPHDTTVGRLESVATFSGPMPTGVTVSRTSRIFVNFPRWGDDVPFTVAELVNGKAVAYPDVSINDWPGRTSADPTQYNEQDRETHFAARLSCWTDQLYERCALRPSSWQRGRCRWYPRHRVHHGLIRKGPDWFCDRRFSDGCIVAEAGRHSQRQARTRFSDVCGRSPSLQNGAGKAHEVGHLRKRFSGNLGRWQ